MTQIATPTAAVMDTDYRKMVSDAAGVDYLATMTRDCLEAVEGALSGHHGLSEELRALAHRLAGGTATVGLPALAATLKAIEKACTHPDPAGDWPSLRAACEAALRDAYAAVAAEAAASSLSSR